MFSLGKKRQQEREQLKKQFSAARRLVIGQRWEQLIDHVVEEVLPKASPSRVKRAWNDYLTQWNAYKESTKRGEDCDEPRNPFYSLAR